MPFSSGYALENNNTHPLHSKVETTTQKPKAWKFSRKLQKGTQEQPTTKTHKRNCKKNNTKRSKSSSQAIAERSTTLAAPPTLLLSRPPES